MILPAAIESATLFLLVGVLLVSSVLKMTRPTSPKLHRYLWGAVLIQGVLFAKWTIGIAWYEAAPETQPSLIKTSHLVEPMELNQVVASQPSAAHFSEQDEGAEKLAFSSMDLTKALSGIWLFGVLVILVRWSASYLLLIRRLRDACPAGGAARHQWREVLKSAGQRNHVPVLFHDQLGPFLVWRPSGYALVLPEPSWIRLSQKHRSTILRHEAAHLSRRDIPASSIARLIALIHWFNPAGWYAVRRFDEAAEWACDDVLAESNPRMVPAFAEALVALATPMRMPIAASAAAESPVAFRISRLLSIRKRDSLLKRGGVGLFACCVLLAGLVQIDLVHKESRAANWVAAQDEEFELQLRDLHDRLATDQRPLATRFRKAISTEAGKIAIRSQVDNVQQELREQARDDAVPGFLAKVFEESNGEFELRSGQQVLAKRFLHEVRAITSDANAIQMGLDEILQQLADTSDVDKLVRRFLSSDAAPPILYVKGLRDKLRPDEAAILDRLGQVFVLVDGSYSIRAGRRGEAAEVLKPIERAEAIQRRIHPDLLDYAQEIDPDGARGKELKRLLADETFHAFVSLQAAGDADDDRKSVARSVDEIFDGLENLLGDGPNGLIVRENGREELDELLARFKQIQNAVPLLSTPATDFAKRIAMTDSLHEQWAQVLAGPLGWIRLAEDYELQAADPKEAVKSLLSEILEEGDEGQLHVRPDRAEEVADEIQEMFRISREVRRRGRQVDRIADRLNDEALASAMKTTAGKFAILRMVQKSLENAQFDAMSKWVNATFEDTGEGLKIRNSELPYVESILDETREIEHELSKDDF